jgi:hypothetical protein
MMHRTRAAELSPRGFAGDEAEQVEDLSQSDPGSSRGEVNAWHDGGSQGRLVRGRRLMEQRVRTRVGIREEEPVFEPVRRATRASDVHLYIKMHNNTTNRWESGRGVAYSRRVSCRPATAQSLPKVNQTLREFRPTRP